MEILYGIGVLAVFVLCLALLSTARRILRSSPLSNAQFGTTRMYGAESAQEEPSGDMESVRDVSIEAEDVDFESAPLLDEPAMLESVMAEAAPVHVMEQTMVEEPATATEVLPASEPAAEWSEEEQTLVGKWARFPKPSRQACNYALECILLGISAYALFKAQRDTLRYKAAALPVSRDRVA